MKSMILKLIFVFYKIKINYLRKILRLVINKIDGGELESSYIRKVYDFYHGIEIGEYTYGGCFNLNNIPRGTRIGRYCSIAPTIYIFNANHPLKYVTTHPYLYNTSLGMVKKEPFTRTKLEIGHDVWLGQNVIITSSVDNIGTGSVVAAGAVVTKNVPPYAIVAGVPAKIIGYRFTKEEIEFLLKSKWWEKDNKYLLTNNEIFKNIDNFKNLNLPT